MHRPSARFEINGVPDLPKTRAAARPHSTAPHRTAPLRAVPTLLIPPVALVGFEPEVHDSEANL
eukprot:3833777-Prymnesium_polylepis.1